MAKKMSLTDQGNLLIERDSGNEILILMQGKNKKENWKCLSAICEQALDKIAGTETHWDEAKWE
jgi:hypothetical protein